MKKRTIILLSIILILFLSACTPSGGEETAVSSTTSSDKTRLTADYNDALTVQSQLALGTIQLEETDLAVNETLAAEILPLWQAVQSLSSSETAASAEVDAVLNQIQDTMDPAQVQAIANMTLTNEGLTAMVESGEIALGRGGGQGQGADSTSGNSQRADGGLPGQGGGPGGGGGLPGQGRPGSENLSEDDIATRRAEFDSNGGFAQIQDRALLGSVVRLMQAKTGEAPAARPGDFFNTALEVVSTEIGVSVEDIQTQINDGQTLVQIIEAAGGDVETIRTAMIDAVGDTENENFTAKDLVDNWLQP